jgi:V8-like Glu-specific endopeptidase
MVGSILAKSVAVIALCYTASTNALVARQGGQSLRHPVYEVADSNGPSLKTPSTPETIYLQTEELKAVNITSFSNGLSESRGVERRGIIGADNRNLWTDTNWPFRTVGKLSFFRGTAEYYCSATLVGPRHVLTARHCAVDMTSGRFSKDLISHIFALNRAD